MTRDEYLGYLNDQTKEVTPVMWFFYNLKGGSLSRGAFENAFQQWAAQLGFLMGAVHSFVFTELNKHFKVGIYD